MYTLYASRVYQIVNIISVNINPRVSKKLEELKFARSANLTVGKITARNTQQLSTRIEPLNAIIL